MNAMLAEITRWQRWVEQFRQRYGLMRMFGPAPSFRFLQQRRVLLAIERPSFLKWSFAPHWHWHFRPVFQRKIINIQPSYVRVELPWQNRDGEQNKTAGEYSQKPIGLMMNHPRKQSLTTLFRLEISQAAGYPVTDPMRMERIEYIYRRLPSQLLNKQCEEFVRRIRREKQRVESFGYSTIVRQYRHSTIWVEMDQDSRRTMAPQPRSGDKFAPNSTAAAQPQWNIAELTDQVIRQIDQKLIAYRERMGKLF